MTFKIVDGREHFYQWDLNRQIIVDDPAIKEVHFCNRNDDCSLVVEVENGIANVPNILLQKSFSIRVFAYDGHATLFDRVFEVKARTRPSDYVYTETEVKRLEDVEEKLFKEIDERLKEVEDGLITDGFATTEYVDEVLGNIEFPDENNVVFVNEDTTGAELDAIIEEGKWPVYEYYRPASMVRYLPLITRDSDYYNFAAINPQTSSKTHYCTEIKFNRKTNTWGSLLNTEVGVSDIPSLDGYATENWVLNNTPSKADVNVLSNSVTTLFTSKADKDHTHSEYASANHTHSEYAKTKHTHDMADVSGLQLAIANRATQEDIDKAIELHNHNDLYAAKEHNHDDKYATRGHVHSYNDLTNKPTIPSIEGLASEAYVDDAIKNIDIPEVDLTGYATEEYVDNAIANIEIPEAPVGIIYVDNNTTGEELTALLEAGNLPIYNHSLSGYKLPLSRIITRTTETEYIFSNASHSSTGSFITIARCIVTSDNTTWSEAPSSRGLQDPISVNTGTGTKDLTSISINGTTYNIPSGGEDVDLSNYYTKSEVDGLIPDTSSFITEVPAEYITETELNNKGYATEQYVTDAIAGIDIPEGGDVDLSNYYTKDETYSKTEVDEAIAGAGGSGGGSGWDLSDRISGGGNKTTPNETNPGNVRIGDIATIMNLSEGYSLAVGIGTQISANAKGAFAAGYDSANKWGVRAFGHGSIGMGYSTKTDSISAAATGAAAIGYGCVAETEGAIALGKGTKTGISNAPGMTVCGSYNVASSNSGFIFVVGNGTSSSVRSNAFTVDTSGNVVAAGTVSPTGADYAEYFEFEDGNTNNEDRIGLLVELVNDKIRLANGTDILGAISGSKGVIGDAEEMNWHGKYERDEFGRCVYEEIRRVQNEGTEFEFVEVAKVKKISKDYDPNKTYIPRSDRPEWAPVGLLGKVLVRHDGTLSAGDYVKAINGIASKSDEKTNVRVLEVVSENVIRVLIR